MTTQDDTTPPRYADELCEAILKYHRSSANSNQEGLPLLRKAEQLSEKFWAANRDLLETQDYFFLRYSHDHTSVYVFLDEHPSGASMMKWAVCKPLGFSGAVPQERRKGASNALLRHSPEKTDQLPWGRELYDAVTRLFWERDDVTRETLYAAAVTISDRFREANTEHLERQDWVIINNGPHDLLLLLSLDEYSEPEKWLVWSLAKIEGWYGVPPKGALSDRSPWVHSIA